MASLKQPLRFAGHNQACRMKGKDGERCLGRRLSRAAMVSGAMSGTSPLENENVPWCHRPFAMETAWPVLPAVLDGDRGILRNRRASPATSSIAGPEMTRVQLGASAAAERRGRAGCPPALCSTLAGASARVPAGGEQ